MAAGTMVGIAPDLAVAVALIKRARELAYGVSGLIAWSVVDVAGRRACRPTRSGRSNACGETCGTVATTLLLRQ